MGFDVVQQLQALGLQYLGKGHKLQHFFWTVRKKKRTKIPAYLQCAKPKIIYSTPKQLDWFNMLHNGHQ